MLCCFSSVSLLVYFSYLDRLLPAEGHCYFCSNWSNSKDDCYVVPIQGGYMQTLAELAPDFCTAFQSEDRLSTVGFSRVCKELAAHGLRILGKVSCSWVTQILFSIADEQLFPIPIPFLLKEGS